MSTINRYEDTYIKRVYEFAESEDNDTNLNNRLVILELTNSLPIIELTEEVATEIDSKTNRTPSERDVKNFLVDRKLQMEDRLTLVGMAESLITKNKVWFYYDRKYKDIIVIPNQLSFGIDDNIDLYKDNMIYIKGSVIPGSNFDNRYRKNLNLGVSEDTSYKVGQTKRLSSTKTLLMNVPWLNNNSMFELINRDINGISYRNRVETPIQFVSLGTVSDLFEDDKQLLPVSIIVQTEIKNCEIDEVKNTQPTEVIIPLNF